MCLWIWSMYVYVCLCMSTKEAIAPRHCSFVEAIRQITFALLFTTCESQSTIEEPDKYECFKLGDAFGPTMKKGSLWMTVASPTKGAPYWFELKGFSLKTPQSKQRVEHPTRTFTETSTETSTGTSQEKKFINSCWDGNINMVVLCDSSAIGNCILYQCIL